jgi:hypothetical protein
MADNGFTTGITINLNRSIPHGTTLIIPATGEAHTFNPTSGVSAFQILALGASADNSAGVVTYAVEDLGLPLTITRASISDEPTFTFDVSVSNLSAHGSTFIEGVTFFVTYSGTALFAGATGDMYEGTNLGTAQSLTALGDVAVPNPVTSFASTVNYTSAILTWVNPVQDYSSTTIRKSLTDPITGVGVGTLVYNSTGTSFTDASAASLSAGAVYYYGAYVTDLVGLNSPIVQLVVRSIPPGYPPVPAGFDPQWGSTDPSSETGETVWVRHTRLLGDDII